MSDIPTLLLGFIFFSAAFYIFFTLAKELTNINSMKTFTKDLQRKQWPVKLMFLNLILFPKLSKNIIEGMGEKFLTRFFKFYGYFLYFVCAMIIFGAIALTVGTLIN